MTHVVATRDDESPDMLVSAERRAEELRLPRIAHFGCRLLTGHINSCLDLEKSDFREIQVQG